MPVCAVQLHHFVLQLFALSGRQAQLFDVVWSMDLRVIFSELGLGSVGAQQGQSDKGAGKSTAHYVLP